MTSTASWAASAMLGKLVLSVAGRLKDGAMFLQQRSDHFAAGGQVSVRASSSHIVQQACDGPYLHLPGCGNASATSSHMRMSHQAPA